MEACPSKTIGAASQNLVLFDLILYQLKYHFLPKNCNFEPRCDNPASFIERFSDFFCKIPKREGPATFCITLFQAEKLRDGPDNLLPILVNMDFLVREHMRLMYPSIKPPYIVTLLITSCSWDKFYSGTFATEPTCLYLKAYTREQLMQILTNAAPANFPHYARFIDILLTVCLPVTRNVNELLYLAQYNWGAFNEPVATGMVAADDEWGQYRCALPTLKRSLSTIYLRPELSSFDSSKSHSGTAVGTQSQPAQANASVLELPLYARYLLVAAYIASYNPRTSDKRFLVKNTGKISSRAKHNEKKADHINNHLVGPRLFPLDRLFAIFYALLRLESDTDQPPPLTSLLVGQVAFLSDLGLIAAASGALATGTAACSAAGLPGAYSNPDDPLANPRYRCLVTLETARSVAKSVNINLNQHLLDFV
ncbi:unnamed protein product [Mesocestoides corti]|uniref:Fungal_trans domain-containing protein n=2 Tax=Mesocestoides corti TaxID=53468 RepID=A0A0R3UKC1_MESCO|nr:unnamed protein product [Mesocestoides corti]